MKDRMKRLSILFMTATLCTGTLYAQCEPVNAEATQPDTYAESTVDAKAEAVLAASLFHYKELKIHQVKEYLNERGVSVRL